MNVFNDVLCSFDPSIRNTKCVSQKIIIFNPTKVNMFDAKGFLKILESSLVNVES